jgi:hypothetical protein
MTFRPQTILRWLFLLSGLAMLGAVLGLVMPVEAMSRTQQWLGLGEFPPSPIAEYLARGLSMMYMVAGVVSIALSTDIRRYRPLLPVFVVALAAGEICLGLILLARESTLGMMVLGESLGAAGWCVLTLILIRRIPAEPEDRPTTDPSSAA